MYMYINTRNLCRLPKPHLPLTLRCWSWRLTNRPPARR